MNAHRLVEFYAGVHTGDGFRVAVRIWSRLPEDLRIFLVDSRGNRVPHEEKVTRTRCDRDQATQRGITFTWPDGSVSLWPRFVPRRDWDSEFLKLVCRGHQFNVELKLGTITKKKHCTLQVNTQLLIDRLKEIDSLNEEQRDQISVDYWKLIAVRSFLLCKMLSNDTPHKRPVHEDEDEVLRNVLLKRPERLALWLDNLLRVGADGAWRDHYLLLITDYRMTARGLLARPGDFLLRPSYKEGLEQTRTIVVNVGGTLQKHVVWSTGPIPILELKKGCERMLVYMNGQYTTIPLRDVPSNILAIPSFGPYPPDEAPADHQVATPPEPAPAFPPPPAPERFAMPEAQPQRADKKRKIDEPALASANLALATEFPDHDWFAVDALADLVQALDTDFNADHEMANPPETQQEEKWE